MAYSRSKTIHIFAGPNAIGKSTLGEDFSETRNITFVNPEEIRRQQLVLYGDNEDINFRQLHYIMDIQISNALESDDEVIIESNLHDIEAYRFIDSYVRIYRDQSICYFHYTDNIEILHERALIRERHLGHIVPEQMLVERYQNSFNLITENINHFDALYFFDNSTLDGSVRVLEIFNGEINCINEEKQFDWSQAIIERIIQ